MEVKQYIKKPIKVDALEWTGKNHRTMFEFLGGKPQENLTTFGKHFIIDHNAVPGGLVIITSEGMMAANIGDFIIKEPFDKDRMFYPCKPNIFKLTYIKAEVFNFKLWAPNEF